MDGQYFIHFVRDHLPVLIFAFFAVVLIGGWVVFESAYSLLNRDEISKLRRRVDELERERTQALEPQVRHVTSDPLVLGTRWVAKGAAATTADGGCLLLVEDVRADSSALITIRVDGLSVHQRRPFARNETLEAEGKLGTYTIEVTAISATRAQLTAWLRSRHQSPAAV